MVPEVYALAPRPEGGPVMVDGEVSALALATWADAAPLEALEVMLGTSQAAFVIQGLSFRAIERRRTWPAPFATFSDYVAGRWGLAYPTAAQLMRSAEVMVLLEEQQYANGITALPTGERVARELSPLRESPGELVRAWLEAVQSAPRKTDGGVRVTAKHVRGVVTRYRPELAGRRAALVRAQVEGAPEPARGAIDLGLLQLAKSVGDLAVVVRRGLARPAFVAACDEVEAADLGEALRGAETWLKRARKQLNTIRRRAAPETSA